MQMLRPQTARYAPQEPLMLILMRRLHVNSAPLVSFQLWAQPVACNASLEKSIRTAMLPLLAQIVQLVDLVQRALLHALCVFKIT